MFPNKGQFSTYLKPVLVIVFGFLMIMVVQQILGFQISVGEEKAGMELVSQTRRDFQKVSNCLKHQGSGGGRYVLSESKLEEYQNKYPYREPECAEDFEYGYSVEVETKCDMVDTSAGCNPAEYSFGERNGSTGNSIENELTLTYPVLIRQEDKNVPGELSLQLRDGEMESLVAGYSKVIKKGNQLGEFNMTLSISNEQTYCTSENMLCEGMDTDHCTELRETVPAMVLEPGSHILRFRYNGDELETVDGVSSEDGCSE